MPSAAKDPYSSLREALYRVYLLKTTLGLLDWDQQVNLPRNSADLRSEQSSLLAALHHDAFTSRRVEKALDAMESINSPSGNDQSVVTRLVRRDFDRAKRLPRKFVSEKTEHQSRSYHAWAMARENDDFAYFAPYLEKTLELAKEESALQGFDRNPYDYHIDIHDPGLNAEKVESLFSALKAPLTELVGLLIDSQAESKPELFRGFPVSHQERFALLVTEKMGFDYSRGRLDRSVHPFCAGDGSDTRMTTRFDPDNPLDSLFSAVHETGHGLYSQGLPRDEAATPLGEAVGMAVHESQSRLWENQVARGRAFWRHFAPVYYKYFHEQLRSVSDDDFYLAVNHVSINPIRVDSDEATYNLHIMLRFELEKALFDGQLSVRDLPGEWNRLCLSIIGLEPKNDTEGVLQDIHWSGGAFGYFPSYALGNMIAAQLWYRVIEDIPALESNFAEGDFAPLLDWLRKNIHRHGRRYDTEELVKRATGKAISPEPLLRYLRERYLPPYT